MSADEDTLRPLRIMISSTRADLMPYRERTRQVLEKLRSEMKDKLSIIEVSMEEEVQTGDQKPPIKKSLEWVKKSEWMVLIVGWHYGTISKEPGNDGRSVTRWEYDYTVELKEDDPKRKVLVFLTGNSGTPNAYHGRADPAENLLHWHGKQNEAQRKGIDEFRAELSDGKHAAFFKDIEDFADQLERTLRKNIDDLPPYVKPNSKLAELILRLLDSSIQPCFRRIEALHRGKVIHDTVHRIRQNVLIPIRTQVLPLWAASGELSRKDERPLARLLGELQGLRTGLDGEAARLVRSEVAELWRRLDSLSVKLGALRISPADQPDELIALDEFTEALNVSMSALEKAFKAANAEMLRQKDVFADLHISMTRELNKEKHAAHLPADERKTLTDEISKITRNRERLIAAMEEHAKWQEVHEELVKIGDATDSKRIRLIQELIEDRGHSLSELTSAIRAQDDKDEEVNAHLNAQFDKLLAAFKALQAQLDDDTWAHFCQYFDLSFFLVDERTLAIVERSKGRVTGMQTLFREIGQLDRDDDANNGG